MKTNNSYVKISFLLLLLFFLQITFFSSSTLGQSKAYEEYKKEIQHLTYSRQHRKAIQLIKEMMDIYPNKKEWLFILAYNYTELRELKTAAKVLEEYLKAFPNTNEAERLLAMNYIEQGLHDKALPLLEKCLAVNPDDTVVRLEYSRTLLEKGLYEKAEKQCRISLNSKPDDYKGWWMLGNILLKEKKYDSAVDAYGETLKLKPKTYDVIHGLGVAYYRNGNYSNAIKYFLQLPGRKIKLFLFLFFLSIPLVGLIFYFKDIISRKALAQKWAIGVSAFFVIGEFVLIRHAGRFLYGRPFPFFYEFFDVSIVFCEAMLLYFLIRLKKWARIAYLIYWLAFSVLVVAYAFVNIDAFTQRSFYNQIAVFLFAIYSLAFLCYFTRPKVKEMFR